MGKLNLIKEVPNFEETGYQASDDAFDHESFATTLYKVINDNDPPLTIGLFGSWGIGKSSIVNILKDKLNDKKKFCYVYFNAWKYSGDSFRRQFLLTVAESDGIVQESLRKEKIARLRKLNHSDIVQDRKESVKFSKGGFIKLGIFILIASIGIFFLIKGGYDKSFPQIGVGIFALSASVIGLITQHLGQIIQVYVDNVVDPKLIFPEQFSNEFDILVRHALKKDESKKIVFVIDDIDRCDVETIKDILVSMKTFLNHSNCYFIVPMDDTSVVQVFKEKNENFGYEQLRKYFGVSLRIPALNSEDIIAFAKKISERYEIPPRITYIAALGNCRDARKMKHFLNSYKLKSALAKEREIKGFLGNTSLESMEMQIAKLIVLEYQFPEFFRFIFNSPNFLLEVSEIARDNIATQEAIVILGKFDRTFNDVQTFWDSNSGLKEFLLGTYTVNIDDLELLTKFKITNQELSLTGFGVQIRNHLVKGTSLDLSKDDLQESMKRNSEIVVDIILKYLSPEIPPVCIRAINLGITELGVLKDEKKDLLLDKVCGVINNKSINYKLNSDSLTSILDNYLLIRTQYKIEVANKIKFEFFDPSSYYKDFFSIINHSSFKKIIEGNPVLSKEFCWAVEGWYLIVGDDETKKSLLSSYNQIDFSSEVRKSIVFDFPSNTLLNKIISDIAVKDRTLNNSLIYDLLINKKNQNNLQQSSPELNSKIFELIENNITDYSYNSFLELGFEFVKNCEPAIIKDETLQKISPLLEAHIPNFQSQKKGLALTDQFLVYKLLSAGPIKNSTKTSLDSFVGGLSSSDFKTFIELMDGNFSNTDPEALIFKKLCINNATTVCIANYEQPSAENLEFSKVIRQYRELIPETYIQFISGLFSIKNESALNAWTPYIKETFKDIEDVRKDGLLQLSFENFKNNALPSQVRNTYGDLLIELLAINKSNNTKNFFSDIINYIDDEDDFNRQFGNKYFDKLLEIYGDETPKAKVSSCVS